MRRFIFDVDGTLTDSRQRIDPVFEKFMFDFCRENTVSLVTGSDKEKTIEQIGERIFNENEYSFNCAGNEIYHYGKLIDRQEWIASDSILAYLENLLEKSKFPRKTGKHIEQRTGMVNFSIVGRNCTLEDRKEYLLWDRNTAERYHLREKITATFPEVDALLGGETGLDIYPKGKNKEQVISFLKERETEKLYYFGDQIFQYGNDYNIAMKCDHRYHVRKWQDTHEILLFLKEAGYCE